MSNPFDFVTSVTYSKKYIIEDDKDEKSYNAYMVNKSLSQFQDTVAVANEMNLYPMLDKKMQYDFYYNIIPKRKRFKKWAKPEQVANIELVKEYFGYSNSKAKDALKMLSPKQLSEMRQSLYKGGKSAYRNTK